VATNQPRQQCSNALASSSPPPPADQSSSMAAASCPTPPQHHPHSTSSRIPASIISSTLHLFSMIPLSCRQAAALVLGLSRLPLYLFLPVLHTRSLGQAGERNHNAVEVLVSLGYPPLSVLCAFTRVRCTAPLEPAAWSHGRPARGTATHRRQTVQTPADRPQQCPPYRCPAAVYVDIVPSP
jgi:hypothetical protein